MAVIKTLKVEKKHFWTTMHKAQAFGLATGALLTAATLVLASRGDPHQAVFVLLLIGISIPSLPIYALIRLFGWNLLHLATTTRQGGFSMAFICIFLVSNAFSYFSLGSICGWIINNRQKRYLSPHTTINSSSRCPVFFALLYWASFGPHFAYAHDWPLHVKMTTAAYQSSAGINSFLSAQLESRLLTANPRQLGASLTPLAWLAQGSYLEDEETYFHQTLRCLDHFYTVTPDRTPGEVVGITDSTEGPFLYKDTGIGIRAMGSFIANSFLWGSREGVEGPSLVNILGTPGLAVGVNPYNWPRARGYQYEAFRLV